MAGPYLIRTVSLLETLVGRAAVIPPSDQAFGVQCVGLVKLYSDCGATSGWRKGANVHGLTTLAPGTVIATFNASGLYASLRTGNHACFFVKFLPGGDGILVLEQHVPPNPNIIRTRAIYFRGPNAAVSPPNNGDAFSVVM